MIRLLPPGLRTAVRRRLGQLIELGRGLLRRSRRLVRRLRRHGRLRRGRLRWAIKISAPDDPTATRWGDTAFADDLAEALTRRRQTVRVDRLGAATAPDADDDVVLVLRGLHRIAPVPGIVNYLWIISHPDDVGEEEAGAGWDRVFAASRTWGRAGRLHAEPLLQAASATRFSPGPPDPEIAEDVLFVGTSRGVVRPVIRDAIETGARVGIYGHDWERYVDASHVRADHLAFARVPAAYRSARIILNDHWDDMRTNGFVSNRLFDASFTGARIVSDEIAGMDGLFGGLVKSYRDRAELTRLLTDETAWPSREERLRLAEEVRRLHSFDARAETLLAYALADARH